MSRSHYDQEDILATFNRRDRERARYLHGPGIDEPLAQLRPAGTRLAFSRQADGTYRTGTAPRVRGAVLTQSGSDYTLRFKEGATWTFRESITGTAFLVGQADRTGNRLILTRSGTSQLLTALTDQAGRSLSVEYDASNRITAVTDPLGRSVRYTYNAAGYLETVTDPAGGVTRYTYDASNRLLTITDPRTIPFLTNEYDAAGRVARQTHIDGNVWTFAYTVTAGVVTQTVVTDPLGNRTTFAYDAQGNLTAITDPLENTKPEGSRLQTIFTYNPFGQPLTVTDPMGHPTTFECDSAGNLTATVDPLGHRTECNYDASRASSR